MRDVDLIQEHKLSQPIDRMPINESDAKPLFGTDDINDVGWRKAGLHEGLSGDDFDEADEDDGSDAGGLLADIAGAFSNMTSVYGGTLAGGMTGYALGGTTGAVVGAVFGAQLGK